MEVSIIPISKKRAPANLFAFGFFEGGTLLKEAETLEPEFAASVRSALAKKRFSGKTGETVSVYSDGLNEAQEAVAIGLGKKPNHRRLCVRKAAATILQMAQCRKTGRVRVLLDSFAGGDVSLQEAAAAFGEIAHLTTYQFDKYKSQPEGSDKKKKVEHVELLAAKAGAEAGLKKSLEWAEILARGTLMARDLINEPANVLTPEKMAQTAEALADKKAVTCKVLEQKDLEELKMGGILGVNQGSVYPPALIILEYGSRYKKDGTVCLVGKGVTFDTGGISIKPSKDMEKMKYDMSGSAAVIATLSALADAKLPVHVVGLMPMVENNVANDPQRPGDIIRMYNGKTVEVLNTDAEGRLILADALAYSERYHPKAIIDLATLTGMCAATFGDKAIGMLGNDAKLLERVRKAGEASGQRCWELPLWDEYAEQIKGHHSDLYNIGGPYGGTITAAKFLQEFVPAQTGSSRSRARAEVTGLQPAKTPWVHLDIAGTAWADSPRFDCCKGATGVGVKLLMNFLADWAK